MFHVLLSIFLLRVESRERYLRTRLECIEEHSPEGALTQTLTGCGGRHKSQEDRRSDRKLVEKRRTTQAQPRTQLLALVQSSMAAQSQFNSPLQFAYYQRSSTSGSVPRNGPGASAAPLGAAAEMVLAAAAKRPDYVHLHADHLHTYGGGGSGDFGGGRSDSNYDLLQASALTAGERRGLGAPALAVHSPYSVGKACDWNLNASPGPPPLPPPMPLTLTLPLPNPLPASAIGVGLWNGQNTRTLRVGGPDTSGSGAHPMAVTIARPEPPDPFAAAQWLQQLETYESASPTDSLRRLDRLIDELRRAAPPPSPRRLLLATSESAEAGVEKSATMSLLEYASPASSFALPPPERTMSPPERSGALAPTQLLLAPAAPPKSALRNPAPTRQPESRDAVLRVQTEAAGGGGAPSSAGATRALAVPETRHSRISQGSLECIGEYIDRLGFRRDGERTRAAAHHTMALTRSRSAVSPQRLLQQLQQYQQSAQSAHPAPAAADGSPAAAAEQRLVVAGPSASTRADSGARLRLELQQRSLQRRAQQPSGRPAAPPPPPPQQPEKRSAIASSTLRPAHQFGVPPVSHVVRFEGAPLASLYNKTH